MVNLRDGLVLDLDMNTLLDRSGNSNNGTNNGSILTKDNVGRIDRAREFDGNSATDYIELGSYTNTSTSWSFSFWANYTGTTTYNYLYGSNNIVLGSFANIGKFGIASVTRVESTINVNDGVWRHFVCTGEGTTGKVYINGELNNSGTITAAQIGDTIRNIGGPSNAPSGTSFWEGDISEFKVWDRALSASEVNQLYTGSRTTYSLMDGLIAGWDFNNNTLDYSGNGWNAVSNTAILTTDHLGKSNQAYDFEDSSSQYMNVGNIPMPTTTNALTINAWVKLESIHGTNAMTIISKYDSSLGTGAEWLLDVYQGKPRVYLYGYSIPNAVEAITLGEWTMITGTIDANGINLYINGEYSNSGIGGTFVASSTNVYIGNSVKGGGNSYFDGAISTVTLQDKVLSADEVAQLYEESSQRYLYPNMKQPQIDLSEDALLDLPLTESSGTAYDQSGNSFDCTVNSGTSSNKATNGKIVRNFNGTTDSMTFPDIYSAVNPTTKSVSYSIWIKADTCPATGMGNLMGWNYDASSNSDFSLYPVGDNTNFAIWQQARSGIGSNTGITRSYTAYNLNPGEWYHIVYTYDYSTTVPTIHIYVNGVDRALTYTHNTKPAAMALPIVRRIGGNGSIGFNGQMSDIKVFDRVISQSEVQKIYKETYRE